jgi:hypothetical protein
MFQGGEIEGASTAAASADYGQLSMDDALAVVGEIDPPVEAPA